MKLTQRESECLRFITTVMSETGSAPFKYEIADHLGASSRGYVYRMIQSLEAKGAIKTRKYEPRGIELLRVAI